MKCLSDYILAVDLFGSSIQFNYKHKSTLKTHFGGILTIIFGLILLFASLNLPGGLTASEIRSVVVSDSLSFSDLSSFAITNLPYHIMQNISLHIFGVSTFSIKLPSILMALGTVIGLIILS